MIKTLSDEAKIKEEVETVFASVVRLLVNEHKNVIGNKWKFINPISELVISKAQEAQRDTLEQVVEWGEEMCLNLEHTYKLDYKLRHSCFECWQELKKEAKDDRETG